MVRTGYAFVVISILWGSPSFAQAAVGGPRETQSALEALRRTQTRWCRLNVEKRTPINRWQSRGSAKPDRRLCR
jgi:hypothetical protein